MAHGRVGGRRIGYGRYGRGLSDPGGSSRSNRDPHPTARTHSPLRPPMGTTVWAWGISGGVLFARHSCRGNVRLGCARNRFGQRFLTSAPQILTVQCSWDICGEGSRLYSDWVSSFSRWP
eukprot:1986328-Pyramimonas_sp.AAC.1